MIRISTYNLLQKTPATLTRVLDLSPISRKEPDTTTNVPPATGPQAGTILFRVGI